MVGCRRAERLVFFERKKKKVDVLVCFSEDAAVIYLFIFIFYCMKKKSVFWLSVIVRGGFLCVGSILGFSRVWGVADVTFLSATTVSVGSEVCIACPGGGKLVTRFETVEADAGAPVAAAGLSSFLRSDSGPNLCWVVEFVPSVPYLIRACGGPVYSVERHVVSLGAGSAPMAIILPSSVSISAVRDNVFCLCPVGYEAHLDEDDHVVFCH
jgi:hypothetical protein